MKIGLDVHGVINKFPLEMKEFAQTEISNGNEIHIITGQERNSVESLVKRLEVPYTGFFSIVDYHLSIGTQMWKDHKDTWWMDGNPWVRTKGDYCRREGIDLHIDNSLEYAEFMPDTCVFVHLPKNTSCNSILRMLRYKQ